MSTDHPIAQLCAALDVTRSGYHAWQQAAPSARAQEDAALSREIGALHAEHRGRYGAPRIMHTLRQRGRRHGTKRIARLLRQQGLRGQCPRRYVPQTTDSTHAEPIAPNRLAETSPPTGPNQIWVADLTYVPTAEGWLFLAVILDLWSRRVVGWAAGASLAATTVLAALQMALRQRQPPSGLLHHSDRGVQYACAEHRAVLAAAGLEASMSRAGNPYDNAAMESFMATYKRECVSLAEAAGGYAHRADATADFFTYVETYYNRVRLHSALGYKTPVDFETQVN
jgi:transposase InsO family protein